MACEVQTEKSRPELQSLGHPFCEQLKRSAAFALSEALMRRIRSSAHGVCASRGSLLLSGTQIRMNFAEGLPADVRPVSAEQDYRVPAAIARMGVLAKELVVQLSKATVSVLGADCPVRFQDGQFSSVDVRLRHAHLYPYTEMKWSRQSTEEALRRAKEHREMLRRVVQEPATLVLPNCPESKVNSRHIAFLGVSPNGWRLIVESVSGHVVLDRQGEVHFGYQNGAQIR